MQAVYGAFTIEQTGPITRMPWTAEDEERLRGRYVNPYTRRTMDPHVNCGGLPFFIGTVPASGFVPLSGRVCVACRQPKVRRAHLRGGDFCFGCGLLQ